MNKDCHTYWHNGIHIVFPSSTKFHLNKNVANNMENEEWCLVCIFKSVSEQRSKLGRYIRPFITRPTTWTTVQKRVFSPTRTSSLSDSECNTLLFLCKKKESKAANWQHNLFFIIDLQYLIWTLQWKLILYDCHLCPSTDCRLFFRFLWLKWKGRRNNYSKKYYVRICM